MAVRPDADPGADPASAGHPDPGEPTPAHPAKPPVPVKAPAPGRHAPFVVDPRATLVYRGTRWLFTSLMRLWFRPVVSGPGRVPETGPVILAPVHRSFADFGFTPFVTERKLFFMTKDSMWSSRFLGWLLLHLGAFPVHRESADREALARAEEVLARGQVLVLFPEGTRQSGDEVTELLEGAAYLAAKTGATVVPLGIGGTAEAMPKGSKIPKRLRIQLVVGEPLAPPARRATGRVSRRAVREATSELRAAIQSVYDEARRRFAAGATD